MSCLNLRLPKAKKAWKTFTSKLQIKFLHKITKSKAINKHKTRNIPNIKPPAKKQSSFFLRKRLLGRKKRIHISNDRYLKKKCAAPVYVDKLFKGPIGSGEKKCGGVGNFKFVGQEEEAGEGSSHSVADDMWESVGLTSPQMFGIDQRAENFIVRFRAEMEVQENRARRL
ncbi:hypothetical protein ACFE04_012287 [Oxalis oulophora]